MRVLATLPRVVADANRDLTGRSETTLEQAALRRIATLVAQGVQPHELFAVVAEEVGRVVDAPAVGIARYESDATATVCGTFPAQTPLFRTGTRVSLEGANVLGLVRERAEPARVDDYAELEGEIADAVRGGGLRSSVGVPIVVTGGVWGAIVASNTERLPENTGDRLAEFTKLLAAAIANAEAREALAGLAEEQAALRRVAVLVAQQPSPSEVFTAVSQAVGLLLDADLAALHLFHDDGTATTIAGWSGDGGPISPLGLRRALDGDTVAARILENGTPARIDSYAEGAVLGPSPLLRSTVGAPVLVEGKLWGALVAATRGVEPLADNAETRIAAFTELIATAIANADSREALAELAEEQAALRRVATLVAAGAPPAEVFEAVSAEVAALIAADGAALTRFEADGTVTAVSGWSTEGGYVYVGRRYDLEGTVSSLVFETGRPGRIDNYDGPGGALEDARQMGWRSAVGAPITVEGRLWGVVAVSSKSEQPLPRDTEDRLAQFTELVATAIANAESRDALARLADEQAALRRVATLVARDAPPGEVFDAVAMEVGNLLDTDITVVGRYDGDGSATAIGSWSASPGGVPVGTRTVLGGHNVTTLVAETARPARVDGYDDASSEASGEAAEIARHHGWRSSIAAPIIVEGRVWGVMLVATQRPEAFPAGAEERLAAFTDLVATALANAQAHDKVRLFGEEQAALGRVATLVASGAAPEQVFTAVVDEASSLLGLERIEFVRYDGDNTGTVIAASGEHPFPPGSTWSLDDPSVMATVARTSRTARIDDYGALKGEIARVARSAGFRSAIGAPMTVEGRLWGVIIAISTEPEPIPERSEARLGQFTDLVSTAVANAEARQALERVAAEQATLRRIATLVAQGLKPEVIFAAVIEETAATFRAITCIERFEPDPFGMILVGVSEETNVPVGTRWELDEGLASAEVYRTGRSARLGADYDWSSRRGPVAEEVRRLGIVSQVSCPIIVEGRLWGVITLNAREELPPDTEQRLEKFTDLVTTAIANAEGKSELAASRRRIVAASDYARRRIERDLHDGVQQQLVSLRLELTAMKADPPIGDALEEQLASVIADVRSVLDALVETARGIHPAILSQGGLEAALRVLARRSTVPVELHAQIDGPLPDEVEVAAYYVAAEALTNVSKHAQANDVELIAALDNGVLTLEVRDDGIGGADPARGSGIVGLTDRVEALGGTISIASPPGGGTTLTVRLPVATAA
jgi:GAF domain-containing protein/two-component sensor histidine kinase